VLGQAVVIGVSAWMFRDILAGLDSFISQRAPVDFSPLAPENQPRQVLFSLAVCSQVLAFTAAWLRLGRAQWRSATNETRALILGGAFLTAFTFAGGETGPFRILYHNRNERVTYASQRCYLVGTKEGDGRLFCPEHAPWTRAVRLDDPALERQGVLENIFTGLSSAKSPE
jgi:hypothetical protein